MISLTFDDALDVHLDHAISVLDELGLRGTFYAHMTSDSLSRRLDDWRGAAASGHELGNHTIFHPALMEKAWVTPGNAIDLYTLDRMRLELQTANRWLQAIDGHDQRTFAYPCSNPVIGRHGPLIRTMHRIGLRYTRWPGLVERAGLDFGSTRQSYAPLLPELFLAARGGGLTMEMTPPSRGQWDRFQLQSAACDGHTMDQMRDFITRSLDGNGWAILQFHGVGGGHDMDCSLGEFQQLVAWIADHHANRTVTIRDGVGQMNGGGPDNAVPPRKATALDA
jgi:sialate O-acetylesterase